MENNNDGNSRVSYMSMVPGELKEFMNRGEATLSLGGARAPGKKKIFSIM